MSKSLERPWQYKGIINEIAGNSNSNHQAIIEFKGKWYFFTIMVHWLPITAVFTVLFVLSIYIIINTARSNGY